MPPVSNGNATLWVRKPHIHSGEPHDLGPGATSLSGHLSSQSAPTLCWEPLPGCPPPLWGSFLEGGEEAGQGGGHGP